MSYFSCLALEMQQGNNIPWTISDLENRKRQDVMPRNKRQIIVGGITIELPTLLPDPTTGPVPTGDGTFTIPEGTSTASGSNNLPPATSHSRPSTDSGTTGGMPPPSSGNSASIPSPSAPVINLSSQMLSVTVSTQTQTKTETKTEIVTTRTYKTTSGSSIWTATTTQTLVGTSTSRPAGFSSNTGGIVGVIIGVLTFLVIVAALIFFCLTRRRLQREAEKRKMIEQRRASHAHLRGEGYLDDFPDVFAPQSAGFDHAMSRSRDDVNLVGNMEKYRQSSSSFHHLTSSVSSHRNPSLSSVPLVHSAARDRSMHDSPLPKSYRKDSVPGHGSSSRRASSSRRSPIQFAPLPLDEVEPSFPPPVVANVAHPKVATVNRVHDTGSFTTSRPSPSTSSSSSVSSFSKTPDLLHRNISTRTGYTTTEESAPPITPPITDALGWTWSGVSGPNRPQIRTPTSLLDPPKTPIPTIGTMPTAGPSIKKKGGTPVLDALPTFSYTPPVPSKSLDYPVYNPPEPAARSQPSPDTSLHRDGLVDMDIGKQRLKAMMAMHAQGSNLSFSRDADSLRDFVDYSRPVLLGDMARFRTDSSLTTMQVPDVVDLTVDSEDG
ncbi:hypothetical protein DL96DRAFT_920106 [Flagelloscypha sp. PMI_526]|nr:hypothetical protein DL96DRAFT_920106 [Flagelloscypha sp. PMI_526]